MILDIEVTGSNPVRGMHDSVMPAPQSTMLPEYQRESQVGAIDNFLRIF